MVAPPKPHGALKNAKRKYGDWTWMLQIKGHHYVVYDADVGDVQ